MAGRMVEYLITLRDQFSAQAAKIAEASQAARKNVTGFGEAANAAEKGVANLAKGTQAAAAGMQNVATNAAKAQSAFTGTGRAAAQSARELELWAKNAAKIEQMQIAMLNRQEAKRQLQQQGLIPGSTTTEKPGLLSRGGNLLGTWIMGAMGVHAADKMITRVGDVDALEKRMAIALGGDANMAAQARDKAGSLSGKYKNTTVLENLKIMDDLRANLPETMDHILKDTAEPIIKMHSFFKAWEGGKHKKHGDDAIGAVIRAGELTANMTGEQIADYAQRIAISKVVMGDKFKTQDFLTIARQANIDLAGSSKTFQTVDAMVLAQAMGAPRAGTAIQSIGQRLVAGNRIQTQIAEGYRNLGLVDMSIFGPEDFNKKGEIMGSRLKGRKWLKDADMLANRSTDWVMMKLLPALEKDGFKGLKGQEMADAWQSKNADKLTHLLSEFTKKTENLAELRRRMGALASDPVLAKALETLFERSASIMRDEQRMEAVPKNINDIYKTYDQAKQNLSTQADRLWQSIAGKGFVESISTGIEKIADGFSGLADAMKNADFKKAFTDMAMVGGATVGLMALLAIVRRLGGALWMLKRFTLIGAGIASAGFLVTHWEGISARLKSIWTEMAATFKSIFDGKDGTTVAAAENLGKAVDNSLDALGKRLRELPGFQSIWHAMNRVDPADYARMFPGESDREAARARSMGSRGPEPGYVAENDNNVGRFANAGLANAAAQRVMVESTVRTTIDPIQVQAPSSIEVRVTGTVNGQVNGTGSIPITTSSPRGQSAADPIAPKVSN